MNPSSNNISNGVAVNNTNQQTIKVSSSNNILNINNSTNHLSSSYLTMTPEDTERKRFMDELNAIMNEIGKTITKMPVMGYRELDLYHFYNEVQSHGGYSSVTEKVGTWSKIWKKLGNFDTSITDASFRLKKNYERFLLEYEYRKFPSRRDNSKFTQRTKRSRSRSESSINNTGNIPTETSNQKRRRVHSIEEIEKDIPMNDPLIKTTLALYFKNHEQQLNNVSPTPSSNILNPSPTSMLSLQPTNSLFNSSYFNQSNNIFESLSPPDSSPTYTGFSFDPQITNSLRSRHSAVTPISDLEGRNPLFSNDLSFDSFVDWDSSEFSIHDEDSCLTSSSDDVVGYWLN